MTSHHITTVSDVMWLFGPGLVRCLEKATATAVAAEIAVARAMDINVIVVIDKDVASPPSMPWPFNVILNWL